jgi:LysM repeat protein
MVQKGDTLFRIARRFNTTVDAILELNPDIEPNNLQIGQQIRVCAIEGPKG